MTVRFIIRRDVEDEFHHWSLRDALCTNVEIHDFSDPDWPGNCEGACDTAKFWSSVIGIVSGTLEMERMT